jgi:hypothetical protein
MTETPFGFKMPPMDITPPKNLLGSTARIYIPGVILLFVVIAVVDRHSAAVVGASLSVAATALILGIELPLIRRTQRRRQEALMADLPSGGIYAGYGGMFRPDAPGHYADSGTLTIDQAGISFHPKKEDVVAAVIPWDEVDRIRVGPVPGKIGVGRLVVSLRDNSDRTFSIPRFGTLAEILRNQQ